MRDPIRRIATKGFQIRETESARERREMEVQHRVAGGCGGSGCSGERERERAGQRESARQRESEGKELQRRRGVGAGKKKGSRNLNPK